ncbi:hypothetical protein ACUM5Y_00935 [Marinomonas dokdonensis]|uniref:hypothetical protein n=1 Tax=Marinomonas dokdonensis TaxID=328224 RepID=UPI0040555E23
MSWSAWADIYVIHNTEESTIRSLTYRLSNMLPVKAPVVPVRLPIFLANTDYFKEDDVFITVDVDSFQQVCELPLPNPLFASFIGKEEYEHVKDHCTKETSAVFSGAPLERRLALLQRIWLDNKPISVMYSDYLKVDEVAMSRLGAEYGFEFQFQRTHTDKVSVLRTVNHLGENSKVIFSLVDSNLYREDVAKDVIKLLFDIHHVMIGPSYPFVRAGALFAVYSRTDEKLKRLVRMLIAWQTGKVMLPANYPSELRVSFNPYLIKAYGMVLPTPASIKLNFDLCSESYC